MHRPRRRPRARATGGARHRARRGRGRHAADRAHPRATRRAHHVRFRHRRVRVAHRRPDAGARRRRQAASRQAVRRRGCVHRDGPARGHEPARPREALPPLSRPRPPADLDADRRARAMDGPGARLHHRARRDGEHGGRPAQPAAHRDRRGGRIVRRGPGRLVDDAPQAQSRLVREREVDLEGDGAAGHHHLHGPDQRAPARPHELRFPALPRRAPRRDSVRGGPPRVLARGRARRSRPAQGEHRDVARRDRRGAALRAAREVRTSGRARDRAQAHARGRAERPHGAGDRGAGRRPARLPEEARARRAPHARAAGGVHRPRTGGHALRHRALARQAERCAAGMTTLMQSEVPGASLWRRGKVRDVYEAGGDRLVIVASDRLSAFDVVLPTPIPGKGRILTQLSNFWFRKTAHLVPNHLVSTDIRRFPIAFRERRELAQRAVLVKRCERVDIECVARGYISGSAWTEYKALGTVAGETLPRGLLESERLPEPIFTPATKAATGHDENISRKQLAAIVGTDLAKELERLTLALYRFAHDEAAEKGLVLADTKFEFGFHDGKITLIDEVLTPDSSRYWDAETYKPGSAPPSYDKQYVRDFLLGAGWNKEPPAPALPEEVVRGTSERYRECYRRIVGKALA